MNIQLKTAMILLGTLLLGGVLGAVVNGSIMKNRLLERRSPEAVFDRMIDRLGLEPSQHEQVRSIFERHRGGIRLVRTQFEKDMFAARDSLVKELDPILTDRQKIQLRRFMKRHNRDKHRPGRRHKNRDKDD